MNLTASALIVIACLVLLVAPVQAVTIHVPDNQPTIQAGIDSASHGDTVLVACGTYYEHDIVMKSGVCLRSETGQADCVTIDAQEQGRVFYCEGVDATSSILGFVIAGGLATVGYPYNFGAGMCCLASSPMLENCTFVGNQAHAGGGMCCSVSSPTLTNCAFVGNQASQNGGAMYCTDSSPTLTGCTFTGNQATSEIGRESCT